MSHIVQRGAVRATAVVVLAGLCLAGWSPTAWAGGADALALRTRVVVVGTQVVARSPFEANIRGLPSPGDGPFFGYLLPVRRSIEAPKVPGDAVPLGPIQIRRVDPSDGWWDHVAALHFTVPDVPAGVYGIHLCNDPCTKSSVGSLYGGGVVGGGVVGGGVVGIGATSVEGRLAYRLWQQGFRLKAARWAARRAKDREADVQGALRRRSELLDRESAETVGLRRAVDRIDVRADRAVAANARSRRSRDVYRLLSLALGVALLGTIFGALGALRRARSNGGDARRAGARGDREVPSILGGPLPATRPDRERQLAGVARASHDDS